MRSIIIAGTHSGCGKTTVTCAILSAMRQRGLAPSSFKCGPDYIDPMFHSKVIGVDSHNLDSFFCDDQTINSLLFENGKNSDISVIEGVMGYYDDVNGRGSAYSIAEITDTPAVIVINCKGMSSSIGAVMKGFLTFKPNSRIAGFIFNRLPHRLCGMVREICSDLNTEFLGYLPVTDITVESRRLGLVTADEIDDIIDKTARLGKLAEEYIDIDKLMELADYGENKTAEEYSIAAINEKPTIAVAKDEAFCFIYADNIRLLEKLGCEIAFFSPLRDKTIPANADGLILSGGYPELHAKELSENISMRKSILEAVKSGMPTIAECGGFMYLSSAIRLDDNSIYEMAGAVSGEVYDTGKLQRFGYITMTTHEDNLLCCKGEKLKAHEFHYWDSTNCGDGFTAEKSDGRTWECGICSETMYAGFPHFYFYSDIGTAERFVRKCAEYGGKNGKTKADKTH